MANELIITEATELTLEANGASFADTAFVQANDDTITTTDTGGFPHVKLTGSFTTATAATANSVINIYARYINIESTNDEEQPQADYKEHYIGRFVMNDVTTAQYKSIVAKDLHYEECEIWLENLTGQTISAGWVLKATPFTYEPGA